jgi:hypothetical protein
VESLGLGAQFSVLGEVVDVLFVLGFIGSDYSTVAFMCSLLIQFDRYTSDNMKFDK